MARFVRETRICGSSPVVVCQASPRPYTLNQEADSTVRHLWLGLVFLACPQLIIRFRDEGYCNMAPIHTQDTIILVQVPKKRDPQVGSGNPDPGLCPNRVPSRSFGV